MNSYTYEYAAPKTLRGTKEEVFAALSEAKALQNWFAEHVDVEPRAGGAFRFWGKHTYDVPAREQARRKLTRFEPPSALSFLWPFMGRDSEVTWRLEEADDGVKITVRHVFDALPDGTRVKALIDDMWRLYTGNLCFHLNGDGEIYRPDFNDPHPEVRQTIVIDAPAKKVFAALVTPELISKWFPAPAPVVEPRVGGKYGFGFSYEKDGEKIEAPPMTILEFVENGKLTITWPDWRGDPSVPDQNVTFILEEEAGKTRLTLIHAGFTRAADVSDYPFGWRHFLGEIDKVAREA